MRLHAIQSQGMIDLDEIAFVGAVITDERTYIKDPFMIIVRLKATDGITFAFCDKSDAIKAHGLLVAAWSKA
jgi:hypothetical protein